MHDFDKNLKTLYSTLVTNNNLTTNHMMSDILSYSALLKLCSVELLDSKLQKTQLTRQVNKILPPSVKA